MEKTYIEFCQIEDISEYKHISDMADFLDFRLSPKMHIKIIVFMGFLPKNTGMCKWIALLYCAYFVTVALILVEIFAFSHGTFLLLILYKF